MKRRHAICTIVARNYVAQARVLARSLLEHNPEVTFYTLVIDGSGDDRSLHGVGEVLLPGDLGIDAEVLDSMHVMYDVMEYATALKPAALMYLHRRGFRTASYFDPDIRVYAPLDGVLELAEASGIVLTPHTLEPIPRDDLRLAESDIMHSGMYNLGFIATGSTAFRFLTWWHDRLTTEAVVDLDNALFTDQRWVDWAPALESLEITRNRGLNVAYWNLHERQISRRADGEWYAGPDRLTFFHFSGYDPAKPWLLTKHTGERPRILLSERPALRELCDAYGRELTEMDHVTLRREPYRNAATPDGLRLTPDIRRLYRRAVLERDELLGNPPNPLRQAAEFREWLLGRSLPGSTQLFSRFEYSIWRGRTDLIRTWPEPLGRDADEFRAWLDGHPDAGTYYREIDEPQGRRRTTVRASSVALEYGWNVVGYARAELGVGEAGRRLGSAIALTGMPWGMVGVTLGSQSRQKHRYRGRLNDRLRFTNTVLSVNADQTAVVAKAVGLARSPGLRAGYWFWEVDDFPKRFSGAFDHVDEVWVSTEFNRASIAARTGKPVRVVPLPIVTPTAPTRYTRALLGLPEGKTIFLVNFDYLSVMSRKNPIGAIRAYVEAFAPGDGACLVVKSINGHLRPVERERVRLAAHGRPDIILREEYLTSHEMQGFTELVDCVVSAHRSEGYGLNLADAMAAGTPVIATGYSGNMDFMTPESAFLIPYSMIEVGPGMEPYGRHAHWADPDLVAISEAMRLVKEQPDVTRRVAAMARESIERFSVARVSEMISPLLGVPSVG